MSEQIEYEGVSFTNVRAALMAMYFMPQTAFGEDLTDAEKEKYAALWKESLKYVIPMQHNFENPINAGSQDTWIQYWIDEDDRLTQDANADNANGTIKTARITVRFLGVRAEVWAKAFHHLTKRKSVPHIFAEYCNAQMLEYVSPIMPVNVDYFKVGNGIAFDLSFNLRYIEYMVLNGEPLEYISLAPGNIA